MNLAAIRSYALAAILSFMALKFSIWPAVFVYPFCLYQILKKTTPLMGTFSLFLLGIIYFFTLFLWATTTGIELNLVGGLISGLIFGLSAGLFKLVEPFLSRSNWLSKAEILVWPGFFYLCQQTLFPLLFVDASYLLDVPPFLPFLYYYVGSGGIHFALMVISIWAGLSWFQQKSRAKIFSTLVIIILLIAQAWHLYVPVAAANKSVSIALIQGNKKQEISWKQANALALYEYYKGKIIAAAQQGAKIIVLPENAILFWGSVLDVDATKDELAALAKTYNSYIILATIETNASQKIESRGYVFSPENGMERPYPAQKVYDYIQQGAQFQVGEEVILYPTPYGNLRLLICFEALFRDQLDQESDLDYDHIVIMANNQFLPSHRGLKTLEWNTQDIAGTYRKNVIYASNNGPTSLTNAAGKTTDRLAYDTEDILWAELPIK